VEKNIYIYRPGLLWCYSISGSLVRFMILGVNFVGPSSYENVTKIYHKYWLNINCSLNNLLFANDLFILLINFFNTKIWLTLTVIVQARLFTVPTLNTKIMNILKREREIHDNFENNVLSSKTWTSCNQRWKY
jgi:hypothetical protein